MLIMFKKIHRIRSLRSPAPVGLGHLPLGDGRGWMTQGPFCCLLDDVLFGHSIHDAVPERINSLEWENPGNFYASILASNIY